MSRTKSTLLAQASFLLLSSMTALPGRAIDIIGNEPFNNSAVTLIDSSSSRAAGFTMPSDSGYTLDSATISLWIKDLAAQTAFSFGLFADNSGNPDMASQLTSFILPPLASGDATYTLTPVSSVTLQPSMTYWLVGASSSVTSLGGWNRDDRIPMGIATSAGYRAGNPPTGSTTRRSSYSIQATLIQPTAAAPGPVPLLGTGIALGLSRRLRRRIQMSR
jgi:hypothetical protein